MTAPDPIRIARHIYRALATSILLFVMFGCETGVPAVEVADAYFKLGNAYFELEQFDSAVNAFTQALEFDASLARAGYNLSRVYLETGRIEEAKRILIDLLEDDPENGILLSTLGWAYFREENFSAALDLYRKVSDRHSGDPDALYNTATLLWRLEEYSEALETFLELYLIDPSKSYLPSIATLYRETDDIESASKHLELYLADDEAAVEERLELAANYVELEEYGRAIERYQQAIDISETPLPDAHFERAHVLLAYIEDYELGFDDLRKALALGFKDVGRLTQTASGLDSEERDRFETLLRENDIELISTDRESGVPGETQELEL